MSSLARRLRDLGPLHGARARVAAFLAHDPARLAFLSLGEIAAEAHVGKATVSRFVHDLGYADFNEMRGELRRDLYGESVSPARRHTASGSARDGAQIEAIDAERVRPLLERHAERASTNVRDTLEAVDAEDVAALCRDLVAADRVWVYGQRLSHGVAFNLALHLQQLLPEVRLIGGTGGTTPDEVSDIRATDHALIVAHARAGSDKLALVRYLATHGVAFSLLTDLGDDAELVAGARHVLRSLTRGSGSFNDYTSSVSLAQALVATLEATAPTARSRLVQVESTLHAFSAFALEAKGGPP